MGRQPGEAVRKQAVRWRSPGTQHWRCFLLPAWNICSARHLQLVRLEQVQLGARMQALMLAQPPALALPLGPGRVQQGAPFGLMTLPLERTTAAP